MPCAPAGDDKTAATVKPARLLAIDNMREAPCYFVHWAAIVTPPPDNAAAGSLPHGWQSTV
jgi:hypothetical protein